jgi:hypothetical protein
LLQRGHALAAAGVSIGSFVSKTRIGHPCRVQPFIVGNTMTLDGEAIFLDRTWREDPSAVALFEENIPFTRLIHRMKRDMWRIKENRERELVEANRIGRLNSFGLPPPQHASPTQSLAPAVPPSFIPRADTHTAPSATVQDGTMRVDVAGMDVGRSLTPGEMDALWKQTGGSPSADPYADENTPEFQKLCAIMPRDMARRQMEVRREAEARRDAAMARERDPYAEENTPEFQKLCAVMPRRMARREMEARQKEEAQRDKEAQA